VTRRTAEQLPDIKPRTVVASLNRAAWVGRPERFPVEEVGPAVGMSKTFIRRVLGNAGDLSVDDVLVLLDQDAFHETFVGRSQVLPYLINRLATKQDTAATKTLDTHLLMEGHVLDRFKDITVGSVQCVVTSTPYWGMRIYKDSQNVSWADGETCAYGHEQTPEGFIRHTTQILHEMRPLLTEDASVWWNLMDSYNTRTQIRGNAAEALRAMQGRDERAWADHDARRYSAGHSYLKDGEQTMIPMHVAERASRIGYFVKSVITWAKTSSLPEPQNSRVSRGLEYVLHLSTTRTPKFDKAVYRRLAPALGGRNIGWESDKLSDVWVLPTSAGKGSHGAQFPTALPGRCIALTTHVGDVVLDPFVGSGNSGVAARAMNRKFVGIDISPTYLAHAEEAISAVPGSGFEVAAASPDAAQDLPMVAAG
jgi:DNA modification methylase